MSARGFCNYRCASGVPTRSGGRAGVPPGSECHTIQKSVSGVSQGGAMKTTLDLNDTLLTQAKSLAAEQRTTLTRLIEEGLALRLRVQQAPSRKRTALPVYG